MEEITLWTFILAVVGSGAVFSLWTYLATQRFNASEALRTAYIRYLAAVELVGRETIKKQLAVKHLSELRGRKPTNQKDLADWTQEEEAAAIEVRRTSLDVFDTRAVVAPAKNTVRLLESDEEFDQRVKNLNMLLADLLGAQANDGASRAVNKAAEDLLERVRTHHPRLAVRPRAVRWRRFWGSIGKHTL